MSKRPIVVVPTAGMSKEQMKAAVWEALAKALADRSSDTDSRG